MSRMTSQYPERVYESSEAEKRQRLSNRGGSRRISKGWMIAGLAGIGLAVYAAWHFGPDIARYVKMERM